MFRALWIWQRWIGVWLPKLCRIALASAFEPSGFESALVVSYDGGGDDSHGRIASVVNGARTVTRGESSQRCKVVRIKANAAPSARSPLYYIAQCTADVEPQGQSRVCSPARFLVRRCSCR